MDFEWDDKKAETNYRKHGVRFSEAVSVWLDENSLEIPDPEHSDDEDRWIRLGFSSHARMLLIIFVEKREEKIRIVSARKATSKEQLQYVNRSKR